LVIIGIVNGINHESVTMESEKNNWIQEDARIKEKMQVDSVTWDFEQINLDHQIKKNKWLGFGVNGSWLIYIFLQINGTLHLFWEIEMILTSK